MKPLEIELQIRNIPEITLNSDWRQTRHKYLDIMQKNEYGYLPPAPVKVESRDYHSPEDCFNGIATYKKVQIICHLSEDDYPWITKKQELGSTFVFDINCYVPKISGKKIPAVIAMNDRDAFDFGTCPADTICSNGIAVFNLRYRRIVNDPVNPNDLSEFDEAGLDRYIYGKKFSEIQPGERESDAPGSIAMWAWGVLRVMDYVQTLDFVDLDSVVAAGHSRIGKTVLLAGAADERFAYVFPNASCGGGVSLSRGNPVESMEFVANRYPNSNLWFCEKSTTFDKDTYIDHNGEPFDQHFLVACIAPRKLYIGNAVEDAYCDAASEFLALVAADKVCKHLGMKGFVYPDRLPVEGDKFHSGDIGYHLRPGVHAFLPDDWKMFLEFFMAKQK